MNKQGAARVLSEANLSINDVDVIELHDCFSCHELILYEALGLCKEGGEYHRLSVISYNNDTCHMKQRRENSLRAASGSKMLKAENYLKLANVGSLTQGTFTHT
jgi:hypothetical protein